MRTPFFIACALVAFVFTQPAAPVAFSKAIGNHELYAEFEDPYYFSGGAYFSLLKTSIPALDTIDEWPVYRRLLMNCFFPNCFVIEAGVYPLPLAGVAARKWAPTWYEKAAFGDINLIRAITESVNFKEPWSLAVFFGHLLDFKSNQSAIQGHANIGLLCSYGYYSIKDNLILPDHWGEFEAKIKVDRKGIDLNLATSYRIGSRFHSNQNIKDEFYIGLNRDRTDFAGQKGFSFIQNTNAQIRGDFSYKPAQVLSVMVEAGKKFPIKTKKRSYAIGLSLGVTWNAHCAYGGGLAAGFIPNTFTPVIRPMFTF